MTDHQILNFADHQSLRVHTEAGAELGDGEMAYLAIPAEFRVLACEFPVVFRYNAANENFSALALLGFESGENLFLQDGNWDASCKPLAMSIQPFLVGRPQDGEGQAQVHLDVDHPRVSKNGDGMRVFDDNGRPTPYLEQISEMLGALDDGYQASGDFYAALERYDLLEPFSMDVTMDDGKENRMVGYHLINEEKVQALEPGALAELHTAGYLEPIFMSIASLGNLSKLVRRKNKLING
ncbi:multidrug transporter [Sphingomonadales bacterium EhC05]|nr:multidrug transporter [Sphingomonadales bacterium EhC05]